MVTRNYTRNLHTNRAMLDRFSRQVQTGRRFDSFSQDNASGIRAMQVRRSLARVDSSLDNARAAQSYMRSAEGMLMNINNITHSISERFVKALNDTNGAIDRSVIATELERMQESILALANGQYAGRYVFGGTNTITAPFTTNEDGHIMYNGVLLRDITRGSDEYNRIMSDGAFLDVGMNISFNNENDPTRVDPGSAFRFTLVGAEFIGTGPHNLHDTITDMINFLRSGTHGDSDQGQTLDPVLGGALLDRFQAASTHLSVQITQLGTDTNFLEFTIDRLLDDQLSLLTRQQELEIRPPEEAILDFKMQEFIYNATLQMGQRLLQPSLFDFIR